MNELEQLMVMWNKLSAADKYTFQKNIQVFDGHNIILGTNTGTQIGTSALQKIGLYGVTPIVQQGAITGPSGGGSGPTNAIDISARSAIVSLINVLHNMGITG